jgi:hypothetical protein
MNETMEKMKQLKFGTELEYTNISREKAAKAIHSVVGGTVRYTGGSYDSWTVTDVSGREWKAVSDASLGCRATTAEVVTPILGYDDIETLQEIVRALRKAGAKADSEVTSQHVHIGVEGFTARQIANLARIYYKQEALLLKAAGTHDSRLRRYTKPTDREFIARLEAAKPDTKEELNKAWFGYANPNPEHYDSARYRSLNPTTYGEWARSNSDFSTASATPESPRATSTSASPSRPRRSPRNAPAPNALASSAKPAQNTTPRPAPPPRTDRKRIQEHPHALLKNLPGSAAWKNGRPEGR